MKLLAVRQNGLALKHIKFQTDEVSMEAVLQNPFALKFVKNKTEQICVAAMEKHFSTIQHQIDILIEKYKKLVQAHRDAYETRDYKEYRMITTRLEYEREYIAKKVDMLAEENMFSILDLIDDHTDIICEKAIKQDVRAINKLNNKGEEIYYKALDVDIKFLKDVDDKSDNFYINALHRYEDAYNHMSADVLYRMKEKGLLVDMNSQYFRYKYKDEWYILSV